MTKNLQTKRPKDSWKKGGIFDFIPNIKTLELLAVEHELGNLAGRASAISYPPNLEAQACQGAL